MFVDAAFDFVDRSLAVRAIVVSKSVAASSNRNRPVKFLKLREGDCARGLASLRFVLCEFSSYGLPSRE
jgi:hypothetical protein